MRGPSEFQFKKNKQLGLFVWDLKVDPQGHLYAMHRWGISTPCFSTRMLSPLHFCGHLTLEQRIQLQQSISILI